MTSSVPWIGFALAVLTLLALDLRSVRHHPDGPPPRVALAWSAAWFALAALFATQVAIARGPADGLAFATAYVVEQALSVDNLFVMMLVFARYRVPRAAQRRALTWGIVGVIVLRGALIASGSALIEQVHALTYVLGGLLLVASLKLAREVAGASAAPASAAAPGVPSRLHALIARIWPLAPEFAGDRFTVVRHGVRHATPLLLALVAIELADAVFALDSIPAVFGVTTDRFLVFTSNLLAVLGLRSLFFALSGLLDRLRFLKHGLVGVLGLAGTKMVVAAWWPAPAWLSLVLVALALGAAIVASLAFPASASPATPAATSTSNSPRISHAERS